MRFLMLHPQRQLGQIQEKQNDSSRILYRPSKKSSKCCVSARMLIWDCLEPTIMCSRSLNFVGVSSRNASSFFATFVVYPFSKP